MIASLIARFHGAAAYRNVIALLLAGCVAGFVLGQTAGHQPRAAGVAAAISPARTMAVIAGALSTPVAAPPHIIVPLSASHAHQGDDDDGHGVPPAVPLPRHDHHKGGPPMPPVPLIPGPLVPPIAIATSGDA